MSDTSETLSNDNDRYTVPALERGLRLLACFTPSQPVWSAPDLARTLGHAHRLTLLSHAAEGEQPVERLYREIRALRIYEGATEVQQLIIGKAVLQE